MQHTSQGGSRRTPHGLRTASTSTPTCTDPPLSGVDPSGTQTDELNYNYEAYPKPDEVDVPIMKKTVERLLP